MERQNLKTVSGNRATVRTEKSKARIQTRKLVFTALLAAIVAALSQVAFPLPSGVPVTLQTFAIALCGYFGGIWGALAVCVYLLLGLVGVPVFANFKGGISAIIGPTGGFLVGFLPMVLLCCINFKKLKPVANTVLRIVLGIVGLAILHLFGAWWFSYQSGNGFTKSLLLVSVPYLVKDVASVVGGYFFSVLLKKKINF